MIRALAAATFLVLYIIFPGLLIIVYSFLTSTSRVLYEVGRFGIALTLRIAGVRVRTEGLENIPRGVCIFAANHVSTLDAPAVLVAIPRRISFLAKKEVFRIPVVATVLRLGKIVPVDRSDRDAAIASVVRAIQITKEGISFAIFPEGSRSSDGRLKPFKKGAFVMAIEAGVPVVPVSIVGSRERMRKGSVAVNPGEIVIRFGPAEYGSAFSANEREELLGRVHSAVAASLPEGMRPEKRT